MKMIIDGKKVDASGGGVIEVLNPATSELIDTVPDASPEDIQRCVEAAQRGKKSWGSMPLHARADVIRRFLELLRKNRNDIVLLLSREGGKILKDANAEFDFTYEVFSGFIEVANHFCGDALPTDSHPGNEKDVIFTRNEPLGVIACIVPFNWPMGLFSHKVAPALLSGNAVIVKPSSENPLTIVRLVELLLEAGVPGDALQIVTGRGSTVGTWLTSAPGVNAVTFTGSTSTGIEISRNAAPHLCRVFLELGGNDPMMVFDDADIDLAVRESVPGRIFNVGQVCTASKRFIVHTSVAKVFVERLVQKLKTLKIGNPQSPDTEMGCLISEKAACDVEKQVELTITQGATCVLGGKRFNKTFFQPTVLTHVTPAMDIAKDMEVFGPVIPIIEFETIDEAVSIANSSKYGLNSCIFTRDIAKALKVASMLENGAVIINGSGIYRTHDMPFGGYKMSGIGREGMLHTLKEMTQSKSIALVEILK